MKDEKNFIGAMPVMGLVFQKRLTPQLWLNSIALRFQI